MQNQELLDKPIWQMTGAEFLELAAEGIPGAAAPGEKTVVVDTTQKHYEYGMKGICKIFGCSLATANRIKASGCIDDAITQIGRKIIIDAEKALEIADYKPNPRMRRSKK